MNLGDIITRVQRQFGDESGAQITTADITRWTNDAMMDIVRKTECLEGHKETNAILNDGTYTLPPDLMFLKRVTLDSRVLRRTRIQELDQIASDTDVAGSGTSDRYYLWGSVLTLWPNPSAAGTANLDIFYIKTPIAVVGTNDTPEIPIQMHEDIVRYCLTRAKELDDDQQGAAAIGAEYDSRLAQAMFEQKSQPVDSYPSVRLLSGDDW